MAKAAIIKVNGAVEVRDLPDYDAMSAVVGGYIEAVNLRDCTVFLNEDGIAIDLPVNPAATRFIKKKLRAEDRVLHAPDGWILGNVFVVGPVDDEGDETDCPEHVIKELSNG